MAVLSSALSLALAVSPTTAQAVTAVKARAPLFSALTIALIGIVCIGLGVLRLFSHRRKLERDRAQRDNVEQPREGGGV